MIIFVRLHGILRDKLPSGTKGQTMLDLPDGARVQDVVIRLALDGHLQVAVNEQVIEDESHLLRDNDRIDVFRPAAGG